jgi:hypothetical protein
MYLAGLLLATGASLALAGPASAAGSDGKCHHPNGAYGYGYWGDDEDYYYSNEWNKNSNIHQNGVFLLSGNIGDRTNNGILGPLL